MKKYLIWSNEHKAWWQPNRHGYTDHRDLAGIYEEAEAFEIVEQANQHIKWGHYPSQPVPVPNEALIPLTKEDL